ncbi:creatininase family protein [Pyrobaculum sp. 3827-6]|uniref:creatininase family protein n=1 Tax=Pyrobaculum sp. 3827-6 TaxID=2983604 RepID=UPI0021D8BFFD|nr:creatininase family protein [Pyrobaculum sp. 3827-6]MCU7787424.1 creatininase family protein [Pyrobaculum sp. 3827-6]
MVCLLPVGSYEQHGPHLPPTVDAEVARYVADKVAERIGARSLPPIYYSCSEEHRDFPQTISVKCRSFLPYFEDVVRSAVEKCGVVVVVVGHGGVWDAVKLISEQLNYELGPRVLPVNIWAVASPRDHAGSDETSIYLATGGSLVGELVEICEGDISLFGKKRVAEFSKTGIVGCLKPGEVSAERGRSMLELVIEKIVERFRQFTSLRYIS